MLVSPLLLLVLAAESFSPASTSPTRKSAFQFPQRQCNNNALLFAAQIEEEVNSDPKVAADSASDVAVAADANKVTPEPEPASYPINLPSPLLLSASMVLAITSTGECRV